MAREIRGWNIGQVVTAAEMTDNTANLEMILANQSNDQVPCIYNGLTLQSQSGTGNSIVTFNGGVARCQNLPLSTYTYLPSNPYGTSYPCFIDISSLDSNNVITLATTPSPGYIVATFSISPNTSGAINYLITGSLAQIATGSYNPQIHVKICGYTYTGSTFVLDFTPVTNRDFDWIGPTGLQWNYQNDSMILNIPPGQTGSALSVASGIAVTINGATTLGGGASISAGNPLQWYDSAGTNYVAFEAPSLSTNTTWTWPSADASVTGQAITSNAAGVLSFSSPLQIGNVAANDSNVVFTSSSNRTQVCTPTAARTYTMPTTSIVAGDPWVFINTSAFLITLNASNGSIIDYIVPNGTLNLISKVVTPTTPSNWLVTAATSQENAYTPAITDTTSTFSFTTAYGYWWRVRQHMYIRIAAGTGSGTGTGSVYLPPPSGYTINGTALNNAVGGNLLVGSAQTYGIENAGQFANETGLYWSSLITTSGVVIKRPNTASSNYVGTQVGSGANTFALFTVPVTGWN